MRKGQENNNDSILKQQNAQNAEHEQLKKKQNDELKTLKDKQKAEIERQINEALLA